MIRSAVVIKTGPLPRPAAVMIFMTLCLVCFPCMSSALDSMPVEAGGVINPGDRTLEEISGDEGWNFSWKGQIKDLFVYQKVDEYYGTGLVPSASKKLAANLQRLRFSPELAWGPLFLLHLDYDNEIMVSSYTGSREFDASWRPPEYNDFFDLSWDPHYSRDLYYRMKLHRAYVRLNTSDFSFTLGRQQIRFGSGRLWNPLDILNPLSPTFVEGAEEQKGTDAVRADWYFTDSGELSFVAVPVLVNDQYSDMTVTDCNYVSRVKTSVKDTDIAVLGGWISRRVVAGMDSAATIHDGLLRGSVIYSIPEEGDRYFQASAGYEYTLSFGLYLLAEYFFNQNAMNSNEGLKNIYRASLVTGINQDNYFLLSNQFITANRHYLGIALGYDIHPLLRDDLFLIIDFEGRAVFVNESLRFNMMENVDLTAGIMTSFLMGGSSRRSEFKDFTGDNLLCYFSLALYF